MIDNMIMMFDINQAIEPVNDAIDHALRDIFNSFPRKQEDFRFGALMLECLVG